MKILVFTLLLHFGFCSVDAKNLTFAHLQFNQSVKENSTGEKYFNVSSICENNFGTCEQHQHKLINGSLSTSKKCPESHALLKGMCPSKHQLCCIANQQDRLKWKKIDEKCSKIFGICQKVNKICGAQYNTSLCGGPIIRSCCPPSLKTMNKWKTSDTRCKNSFGTCQHRSINCSGDTTDYCGGPSTRVCCLPNAKTIKDWEKNDKECIRKWGKCQSESSSCSGSYVPNLCGGNSRRKCCVPAKKDIYKWEKDCVLKFGKCIMNQTSCKGDVSSGLCRAENNHICCLPMKEKMLSWKSLDENCLNKGGKCQHKLSNCQGKVKNICGGPEDRICCLSSNTDTTQHHNSDCKKNGGVCISNRIHCDGKIETRIKCPLNKFCCHKTKFLSNIHLITNTKIKPTRSTSTAWLITIFFIVILLMIIVFIFKKKRCYQFAYFKHNSRYRNRSNYETQGLMRSRDDIIAERGDPIDI